MFLSSYFGLHFSFIKNDNTFIIKTSTPFRHSDLELCNSVRKNDLTIRPNIIYVRGQHLAILQTLLQFIIRGRIIRRKNIYMFVIL